MAKFTSRADLLIAAGESIKMQSASGIEPMCKYDGEIVEIGGKDKDSGYYPFALGYGEYEFPIAVIEGKPAFCGDVLYDFRGDRFVIGDQHREHILQPEVSWNPPKPKTVMVELLREDAEHYAEKDIQFMRNPRLIEACRKALEK